MHNIDIELDTRGLSCPLPILKAKKSITGLAAGQVIKVKATDPGALKDFAAFCKQTGNILLDSVEQNGEFQFIIQKAA